MTITIIIIFFLFFFFFLLLLSFSRASCCGLLGFQEECRLHRPDSLHGRGQADVERFDLKRDDDDDDQPLSSLLSDPLCPPFQLSS